VTEIIAEIGSVHDGSFGNAMALIDLAHEVGANAVKFQTHIAAAETTRDAPNPPYFKGEPRFEYFERTAFSVDQWKELREHASTKRIKFGSSPFAVEAVEMLEEIGVDFLKIASGEVTNTILLERCAESSIPIYLSSGMSNWEELDRAVEILSKGQGGLIVLQCTSAYPCPNERVGLNVMSEMRDRWNVPVGFSDHTEGLSAAIAATTLGAAVIEKHLTFSRKMYGSDASLAALPELFSQLTEAVRAVNCMMENPIDKDNLSDFISMKQTFEKSIVANKDLKKGTVIDRSMIAMKKPGTGLSSKHLDKVIGAKLIKDVNSDHLFNSKDFDF
jgi:N-acetylneuraminate synthase